MSGTTKRIRKQSESDEGSGGKKAALEVKNETKALAQEQIKEAAEQIKEAAASEFDVNYIKEVLFHEREPVLSFAEKALDKEINVNEPMDLQDVKILSKLLSGIRVEAKYFGKIFRHIVKEVTEKSALETVRQFKIGDVLVDKSVADNFGYKGSPVKYPNLQCLHMKTRSNFIYVPLEFCEIIEGQPRNGMLKGPLATFKIRKSRLNYEQEFHIISEFDCPAIQRPNDTIIGRRIEPPYIQYADDRLSAPNFLGLWSMADSRFFQPQPNCVSWALVSILPENKYPLSLLDKFADKLAKYLELYGIEVDDPKEIRILNAETELHKVLACLKGNVNFAMVALEPKSKNYFELKENADYESSLITQCITGESIEKILQKVLKQEASVSEGDNSEMKDPAISRSYLNSLCMNINTKLGGINHQIISTSNLLDESLVIIGAYSSSPDKNDNCPSVAAVLGCQNAKSTRYVSSCRVQNITAEAGRRNSLEIQNLDKMTNYVLKTFLNLPKSTKPTRIIYLRNGVHPDDYKYVLEKEVVMIKKACMGDFSNVSLTYIMVTKEHSTFLERSEGEKIESKEITPGESVVEESDDVKPVPASDLSDSHEIKSKSKDSFDSSVVKQSEVSSDSVIKPLADDSVDSILKPISEDSVDSLLKPISEDSVDSLLKPISDDSVDSLLKPLSESGSVDNLLKQKSEDLITRTLKSKASRDRLLKLKSEDSTETIPKSDESSDSMDLKPKSNVSKTEQKVPIIEKDEDSSTKTPKCDRKKRYPDAGASVNSITVHPQFFDFFITSQGNCKSALYTVMYDENNVKADQIEDLCFHLCFLYSKCCRSISYPAPITYARSIVTKARRYIRKKMGEKTPTFEEVEKLIEGFDTRNDMLLI